QVQSTPVRFVDAAHDVERVSGKRVGGGGGGVEAAPMPLFEALVVPLHDRQFAQAEHVGGFAGGFGQRGVAQGSDEAGAGGAGSERGFETGVLGQHADESDAALFEGGAALEGAGRIDVPDHALDAGDLPGGGQRGVLFENLREGAFAAHKF